MKRNLNVKDLIIYACVVTIVSFVQAGNIILKNNAERCYSLCVLLHYPLFAKLFVGKNIVIPII